MICEIIVTADNYLDVLRAIAQMPTVKCYAPASVRDIKILSVRSDMVEVTPVLIATVEVPEDWDNVLFQVSME